VQTSQFFQVPLSKILTAICTNKGSPLILSTYICIFARILFASREVFYSYASSVQNSIGGNVLITFVDMWLKMVIYFINLYSQSKADDVISALRRKMGAISLLSLYPTDNALLNERFGAVINLCVQVLYEVDEVNIELSRRISEKSSPENEFESGWDMPGAEDVVEEEEEDPITEENEYGRKRMVI
jgi:hypothetical protein